MVQQKIVMEVSMNSEKCRLKAMKIALVAGEQLCIKLQLSSFAFDNYNLGLMFKKMYDQLSNRRDLGGNRRSR
jgi:hypothetical protein